MTREQKKKKKKRTTQRKKEMLFQDSCEDKGDHYVIGCVLNPIVATKDDAEMLYEYIRDLRKLPKPFHFTLDAKNGKLFSYVSFLPGILKEASAGGVSDCLSATIYILDSIGVFSVLSPIVDSMSHLTTIRLISV